MISTPVTSPAPVYLDYNATAPLHPKTWEAMQQWVEQTRGYLGNPSSAHYIGNRAFHALRKSKQKIAEQLGADEKQVILTASGTEANNWVLKSYVEKHPCGHIIISAIEHPAILKTAEQLKSRRPDLGLSVISVDQNGSVDLDMLKAILQTNPATPALVCAMMANNETGIVQPIDVIQALVHEHRGWFLCDAVQALGKIPLHFANSQVDFMTFSAHKIGGPQGIGLLLAKYVNDLNPITWGGRQENSLRAGTENVLGAIGFAASCAELPAMIEHQKNLEQWRDQMELGITTLSPTCQIVGHNTQRLPNTSCILTPNIPSQTQVIAMDLEGIAISSGSACASGKISGSHVLSAMGFDESTRQTAIRVSSGFATTQHDYQAFLSCWTALFQRMQERQKTKQGHAA